MNYIYDQKTGRITRSDGEILGLGYSGRGNGKNNPEFEDKHGVGPIPKGWYTIDSPHDSEHKGPITFHLFPDSENEMFDRDAFMIHGDSIEHPGEASDGCIIAGRVIRTQIAENIHEVDRLEVV